MIETAEKDHLKGYPSLIFSHGEVPETPPAKNFIANEDFDENEIAEKGDLEEDEFEGDQFY